MGYGNKRADCIEPAKKLADELTKMELMRFRGRVRWRVSIWENVGWHYCVISPCGRWKVHPHHKGNDVTKKIEIYNAFLGNKGTIGGYYAESGKTVRAAIVVTARKAYADITWRAALLDRPLPPREYA